MSDLWGQLAESTEGETSFPAIVLPKGALPRRQPSLRERLVGSYLSGFLPAYMAIGLGASLATSRASTVLFPEANSLRVGLLVCGWVLALPLAWASSSLWSVAQATVWRYAGLALLALGLGELVMTVPYAGARSLFPRSEGMQSWLEVAESLYETYLSSGSLGLGLATGAVLAFALLKVRRSSPWLEPAPAASRRRQSLALLLLMSPLLALVAALAWTTHRLSQRNPDQQVPYSSYQMERKSDAPWEALLEELQSRDPQFKLYPTDKGRPLPTSLLKPLEQRVRKLHRADPAGGRWDKAGLMTNLLYQADRLENPRALAWDAAEYHLKTANWSVSHPSVQAPFSKVIFPGLAHDPMSRETLLAEIALIERLQQANADPKALFEKQILKSIGWYLNPREESAASGLVAFGVELPVSLPGLLRLYREKQALDAWNDLQLDLDWSSQRALDLSLLANLKDHRSFNHLDGDVLESACMRSAELFLGLRAKPVLDGARLMALLRLYKLDHGEYPANLEMLASKSPLPEQVAYASHGSTASLEFLDRRDLLAGVEAKWTLR